VESEKGIGTSQLLHRWWGNSSSSTDEGCLEYVQYWGMYGVLYEYILRTARCSSWDFASRERRREAEEGMTKYCGRRSTVCRILHLLEHGSSRSARAQRFRVAAWQVENLGIGEFGRVVVTGVRDQSLSDDALKSSKLPGTPAALG
jgi:hypothetical protein